MRILRNSVCFHVSASVCILLAMMVLVLPLKWVAAAITAAAVHELCHGAAVILCGGRITRFLLGSRGAAMEIRPMSRGKELICALAGPVGGLLLLLLAKWIPRTAVCAAFHSLYNLLPIYPLDGGRALRCGAELLSPARADVICRWIERICLWAIAALAVYACFFLKLGIFPLLPAAALWLRKSPCKPAALGVQWS